MKRLTGLYGDAGFTVIEVLLVLTIVGGFVTAMVDTFKEGKDFRQELNKNVISPLNPPKAQDQAGPINNNPWIFPAGTADPFKQPVQQPQSPREPVMDPNSGAPIDTRDPCEAKWTSTDGGKTKTLVPGSCTKPWHGSSCSLAGAH